MGIEEEKVQQANIKRFKELHHQKARQQAEQDEYDRLFNLLRNNVIANPETLKDEGELNYVFSEGAKPDLIELIKDYKEQYGKEPIHEKEGFALAFNSKEEAIEFFKDQAVNKSHAFDMYNKEIDHRVYSDGKGTFVHGTQAEVSDYLKNKENYEVGKDGGLAKKETKEQTISFN